MRIDAATVEQRVWGLCLILAQLMMALSTFFWQGREYGVTGGTMAFISTVLWIPAMIGLYGMLKEKMPIYATVGLLVAIYGCVGGASFGFEGVYTAAFDISHEMSLATWTAHPLPFNILLFWPGPLFPLSLLVLAVNLARTRTVPLWCGVLLAAGAVAFPLSRIPRIELIAHGADLLLLIPAVYLGWALMRSKQQPGS